MIFIKGPSLQGEYVRSALLLYPIPPGLYVVLTTFGKPTAKKSRSPLAEAPARNALENVLRQDQPFCLRLRITNRATNPAAAAAARPPSSPTGIASPVWGIAAAGAAAGAAAWLATFTVVV